MLSSCMFLFLFSCCPYVPSVCAKFSLAHSPTPACSCASLSSPNQKISMLGVCFVVVLCVSHDSVFFSVSLLSLFSSLPNAREGCSSGSVFRCIRNKKTHFFSCFFVVCLVFSSVVHVLGLAFVLRSV